MSEQDPRPTSLAGKVVVVTGASSGIGRAYARRLSAEGARLVLSGRDERRLADTAASLAGESVSLAADIADPATSRAAVELALDRFGDLDVVLSNAGLYFGGDFVEADPAAIAQLVSVNVTGALAVVRAALPHLVARGSGDVLFTSSVSGHQPIHWEPVYTASKHAIQAFVSAVRRQLVGTGVRMGAVAPGVVLNPLWGHTEGSAEAAAEIAKGTGITSDDVADAVVYMLTRPRHVTIRDLVILPSAQEI